MLKRSCFILLILSLLLFGCSPARPASNPNLTWQVDLQKYEVKDKLETIVTVPQYVGSVDEVRQQYPAEGNVFLIMKVIISKQGGDSIPFDWSKLTVQDGTGKSYQRDGNDSFLEQFKYTPRLTGLELKFGQNEGWLCYEIPAQAASGRLTLTYTAEGSQQEITIKN
jgi:hypothetical protein